MEDNMRCAKCKRTFDHEIKEDFCLNYDLCNSCDLDVMENGSGAGQDYE